MNRYSILYLSLLFIASIGCKKKTTAPEEGCFQKSALLEDITSGSILPRYAELKTSVGTLSAAWNDFKSSPNSVKLALVQDKWLVADISFQRTKLFNFGPALDNGLMAALGTFPTDTSKVNSNINSATSPNLYSADNIDAVGFPALEFLFFEQNAMVNLTSNEETAYIDALLTKIENEVNTVHSAWTSSYANSFKQSSGTESTSGFSLLINAFNFDYELAKNAKLGIPIGKQSLGIAQMQYVEAPYSGKSLLLLKENLKSIFDLYQGITNEGADKISFDDYLISLEKQSLNNEIKSEMTIALADFNLLSDNLIDEIQNQPTLLNSLYTKLQNLVVHFKTDMTSAFGVLITYQDSDGD